MAQRLPFTRAQFVARLVSQDGVCESPAGSNVQPYSKALGRGAEPWCADLIAWAMLTLGFDVRKAIPGFAWCSTFAAEMVSKFGWAPVAFNDLQAGDVIFLGFTTAGHIEHVETATGPASASHGTVPTVGGNTARAGETRSQSNGGRVAQRIRYRQNFVCARRPLFAVPTPAPAPRPAAHNTIHVVARGESLSSIAGLFRGMTWERLYAANRALIGSNPNALRVGMRLVIPVTGTDAGRVSRTVVRRGESLSLIAGRLGHGMTWQRLYAANKGAIGANPNALRVGMSLVVPW